MKKLLVLAMVLIFAAFPAFAEMKISGEFDYYMVNGFDKDEAKSFDDQLNKLELDFSASVGDYSKMNIELEEDGSWNSKGDNTWAKSPEEGAPSFNYAKIITDWGKFFGLEKAGIKTTIGLDYFETKNKVNFSGFGYEYSDNFINPHMSRDFGGKLDLTFVDGLIQPYAALSFDTGVNNNKDKFLDGDGKPQWMVGAALDFKKMDIPLWIEGYYIAYNMTEDTRTWGVDAMYNMDFDQFGFKVGGYFEGVQNQAAFKGTGVNADKDNKDYIWGAAVAFNAFGAQIAVSGAGYFGDTADDLDVEMGFAAMGVDASYFFLDWLGINAGVSFAFGDYKEEFAGDTAFQTFEVGAIVKPSKGVEYRIGYMLADDDATDARGYFLRTLNTTCPTHGRAVTAEKGGLYFTTKIDF
ncbi:MAG: hypothetical protein MJ215_06115 [Spirochaetia bacterium]|nr:hypothetical protein [Spirochaetia bacterium]